MIRQTATRKRPKTLRIWSAACSTGEEPYSIAIKVLTKRPYFTGWRITLLGTDLSGAVLNTARLGTYDARAIRLIEAAQRTLFFDEEPAAHRWTVKPELKALVTWKQHNLLSPLEQDPFDCIFLKNVLIYFDTKSKQSAVANIINALASGGYLVTGPTEGIYAMLGPLNKVSPWLYQRPA
jgi:chemotaxis protein methyltransferase CheR